jgi:hypothetical protein
LIAAKSRQITAEADDVNLLAQETREIAKLHTLSSDEC